MKEMKIKSKKINYLLRSSKRAKRIRMTVYCDGSLVITKPKWIGQGIVDNFISKNVDWIISKLEYFKNFNGEKYFFSGNKKEFLAHKKEALEFIKERISHYNKIYNYQYNKINVRNQKTRWGSCSRSGNLNFNYKIFFLPIEVADYVIVHELCHLKEFNHSKQFWDLVRIAVPRCDEIKKKLKR